MKIRIAFKKDGVESPDQEVEVDDEAKVEELMDAVTKAFGILPADQELRFDGKQLKPGRSLKEYSLGGGATVTLTRVALEELELGIDLHNLEGHVQGGYTAINIGAEATVKQLKEKIKEKRQIDPLYQNLSLWNNKELDPLDTLKEAGVPNDARIVLKHSNIDVWKEVVEFRAADIDKEPGEDQAKFADITLKLIELLWDSEFFLCYHGLIGEMRRISREAKGYFGGDSTAMEMATSQYFFDLLKGRGTSFDQATFKVKFERKTSGIHSGCIATIRHDGIDDVYYIKTHHMGATKSSSKSASPPDLREVFAYVLLEAIGLGPECHFFGPIPGRSNDTLYIGTKSIPGLKHIEDATGGSQDIKMIIFAIHVASSVLRLGDVHTRNCGYYDGKPSIFDFNVRPFEEGYDYKLVNL